MKSTRRSTSRSNARLAYTLIELLLAMMLSTVVLSALWSLLNIYTKLFDTAGVETEQAQLARAMIVMIETDLINIVPEADRRRPPATVSPGASDPARSADTTNNTATGGVTTAPPVSDASIAAGTTATTTSQTTNGIGTSNTAVSENVDAFSSDGSSGFTTDDPQHATFAQPSLLGTSERLWLVVHRHRDTSSQSHGQPLATADTTFQPAEELAIVEYALTYQDGADAMGTIADAPSLPFATDNATDSLHTTEASSAEGLDDWQGIANSEMETAAAQLGPIDRQMVDASLGIERREALWPVSPLASSLTSTPFDMTSSDEASGGDGFALQREFTPPSRIADIQGRTSQTPSSTFGGTSAAEAVQFKSLLTPEVVRVRFRYHDGRTWRSQWDSRVQGALPRAVEIILAVLPTDRFAVDRDLQHFEESQSASESPWPVYRYVVALPIATDRHAQRTEESTFEGTPASDETVETTFPAAGGANQ